MPSGVNNLCHETSETTQSLDVNGIEAIKVNGKLTVK